ncbi:META and DUF4377 domain-containing protein [Melaminivora sp.]
MQKDTPYNGARLGALAAAAWLALGLAGCANHASPTTHSPAATTTTTAATATPPMSSAPSTPAAGITAYDWDLAKVTDAQGQTPAGWQIPGQRPARLHFEAGRLTVHNLCNLFNTGYALQGQTLLLMGGLSTRRACPDEDAHELQQRVALYLSAPATWELRPASHPDAAPQLELVFGDGLRWQLAGVATAETRYGGPGERVFLEVGPQRIACSHGLIPNAQCLNVRELRYADNGVRQSAGPWQPLYDEIEGFTHRPGTRQVLRLKRFQRPAPVPADASSLIYLLDMVVETERVR